MDANICLGNASVRHSMSRMVVHHARYQPHADRNIGMNDEAPDSYETFRCMKFVSLSLPFQPRFHFSNRGKFVTTTVLICRTKIIFLFLCLPNVTYMPAIFVDSNAETNAAAARKVSNHFFSVVSSYRGVLFWYASQRPLT
jgi:hypothetical protein